MEGNKIHFLLKEELRLTLKNLRAYPLDTVSSMLGMLILIIPLALGLKNTGNTAQLMTLIFLPLLNSVTLKTSNKVKDCTDKGILEQCFNGIYSLVDIIVINNIVNVFSSTFQTIVALIIILLSNPTLPMTIMNFIFIFATILINGFSFGLFLCGLSLVYKKLGSLNNLIGFLIFMELMLPIYSFPKVTKILFMLIAPAGGILSYAQGLAKLEFALGTPLMIALVILNSFIWLVVSIYVYNTYYNKARHQGTLAYY